VGTAQYHLDLALESFGEAEQVLTQMKDSRTTARLWRELGDGLRQLGESQRAVAAYDRSFEILGLVARATNARAATRLAR
jgi:predicted negative regulator of RcsB-dependent stress response